MISIEFMNQLEKAMLLCAVDDRVDVGLGRYDGKRAAAGRDIKIAVAVFVHCKPVAYLSFHAAP
jgi:hypothetical protein